MLILHVDVVATSCDTRMMGLHDDMMACEFHAMSWWHDPAFYGGIFSIFLISFYLEGKGCMILVAIACFCALGNDATSRLNFELPPHIIVIWNIAGR